MLLDGEVTSENKSEVLEDDEPTDDNATIVDAAEPLNLEFADDKMTDLPAMARIDAAIRAELPVDSPARRVFLHNVLCHIQYERRIVRSIRVLQ